MPEADQAETSPPRGLANFDMAPIPTYCSRRNGRVRLDAPYVLRHEVRLPYYLWIACKEFLVVIGFRDMSPPILTDFPSGVIGVLVPLRYWEIGHRVLYLEDGQAVMVLLFIKPCKTGVDQEFPII